MDLKQMLFKRGVPLVTVTILCFFLTSCLLGPNYHRPGVAVPDKFKEAKGKTIIAPKHQKNWKVAHPRDDIQRGEWWKIFNDPALDALEKELNIYNQSIANAVANYDQARELVNKARAGFFPTIAAIMSYVRQTQGTGSTLITTTSAAGTTTSSATTGIVGGSPLIRSSYSAVLQANWEPDFWGIIRRTVESNVSSAESMQALLAATRLSAQGALAQYYFELATLDRDQDLLDKTTKNYKIMLDLTRHQYASGVASQVDIVQAQNQLEIAQAQAINNGVLRAQYEHAIAVLVGRPPADFSMPFKPLNATPPAIPVFVPSCWLERRPDIAQAERLMQQTNAQIGITLGSFYPSINLSGTGSAGGLSLPQLIQNPIIGWNYGLQIAQIIFDGGLREATVNIAKDAFVAQVANYRQTVLTAFQNVEDNLVGLRIFEKEGKTLNAAAASAHKVLELTINQYKAGTVPYSSVVTAQITAFTAQKNAYDVVGLQMTSAVGLVKALGGGWSTEDIRRL